MKLQEAIDLFLKRYTNIATLRAYRSILYRFADAVGKENRVETITKVQIEYYALDLEQGNLKYVGQPREQVGKLSKQTLRKHLKAIRQFFDWLSTRDLVEKNNAVILSIPAARAKIEESDLPSDAEINILRQAFFGNWRNAALFNFLVDTGCRAVGLATLELDHLDLRFNSAMVIEKFDKRYQVWFQEQTRELINLWLQERPMWNHRYVFGTIKGHLHPDTISLIIRRECRKLGIRDLHAHLFRYRKGTDLAQRNVNANVIAEIMGHDKPETAMKYYIKIDPAVAEHNSRLTFIQPSQPFTPLKREVK